MGRDMRWTLIIFAALLAACTPKDEGVTVVRLPDGAYRLTLKAADLTSATQAQQLLLPAALQLCGKNSIAFGPPLFDSRGPLPRLVQDVRCEAPATAPPPTAFAATDADERAVTELSEAFLKARDAGDLARARDMFPAEWSAADQKVWSAEIARFRDTAGAGTKQAISRISWFENPPAAPAPGVYAAVDYVRAFERVKTACGFIVWRRQANGSWRIDRERLNFLTPAQEADTSPADLPEVRVRLGCR